MFRRFLSVLGSYRRVVNMTASDENDDADRLHAVLLRAFLGVAFVVVGVVGVDVA